MTQSGHQLTLLFEMRLLVRGRRGTAVIATSSVLFFCALKMEHSEEAFASHIRAMS
jgi:hypothetical protein